MTSAKYVLFLICTIFSTVVSANQVQLTCIGHQDYYPTVIAANILQGEVISVEVTEAEGDAGIFVKNANNIFTSTSSILVINTIVTFSSYYNCHKASRYDV